MSDRRKASWTVGAMVIVPWDACCHQRCNTGTTPARYLALTPGHHGLVKPYAGQGKGADVSMKEGGHQIEYEDEDPNVHQLFESELKKHGAPCRMKAFIPWCTGEVSPTSEQEA